MVLETERRKLDGGLGASMSAISPFKLEGLKTAYAKTLRRESVRQ